MASRLNLDIWLGPILLGSSLNTFLLGFVIVQTYQYFAAKHKDKFRIKLLVCWVLIMEILTAAIDILVVWHFCITEFGTLTSNAKPLWASCANFLTTMMLTSLKALVSLPVQLFFAHRVMVLTRNIWFGSLIGFAAGIIFLCALGLTICDQLIENFAIRFPAAIHVVSTLGISLHLANDLAISASLVWYLHRHRTGLPRSDALITDIIRLTVQTGTVTVIAVIYVLVLMEVVTCALLTLNSLTLQEIILNARNGWSFGSPDGSLIWNTAQTFTPQSVRESGPARNRFSVRDDVVRIERRDTAEDDHHQYSPTTQRSCSIASKENESHHPSRGGAPSVIQLQSEAARKDDTISCGLAS
ncbi:hypothetical protein BS47DRAFT_1353598 [Hydnum rufescens UP504]|uniref:DUF6534 domain-containing protein n=1 Tax=Hydnum rufescens UP504 TaxID=1448309 RepID=A0A9P6AHC3_9AGAM|nr:hypothetical protein BS47DRAFT_1353598 [Hydnum rufescens UP504]